MKRKKPWHLQLFLPLQRGQIIYKGELMMMILKNLLKEPDISITDTDDQTGSTGKTLPKGKKKNNI
ncbi:MAG: hypothetical protein IPI90_19615 [Saprospiraceae bacterium]|nr:hypothetical protein [Candidatus Vicinibacter affinis]